MKALEKMTALSLSVFLLAGCAGSSGASIEQMETEEPKTEPSVQPISESKEQEASTEEKTMVIYFSATGTTRGVAEKIASITGGDLYEILAAEPYTEDDLNWHDSSSRSTKEQNDASVRPEIGSDPVSLDKYDRIFIGYPIWWGEEPRIMDTFVESTAFPEATVIPFCTSSSSGMGRSGKNLAALAGRGTWLDGQRFGANASESDIQAWIDGLKE